MSLNLSEDPSGAILKEWNGFGFRFITKQDYPAVIAHLQGSYYLDEPMNNILGVPPERSADLDDRITNILNLNHGSFYAYPLDDPSKIAAVLIIWYQGTGNDLPRIPGSEPRSPITTTINDVFIQLMKQYSVEKERGISFYPDIHTISSDGNYRGKGLATEMFHKAISKFRAEGHKFVASMFTNPLSRKIGYKLGFKPVSRLDYSECFHDDGRPIFGEAGKNHYVVEAVLDL